MENKNEPTPDEEQALQINENTIADPGKDVETRDEHLHSRRDVVKQDQALQINENTIADTE